MGVMKFGKKIFGKNKGTVQFLLFLYNHLPFNNQRSIKGKKQSVNIRRFSA